MKSTISDRDRIKKEGMSNADEEGIRTLMKYGAERSAEAYEHYNEIAKSIIEECNKDARKIRESFYITCDNDEYEQYSYYKNLDVLKKNFYQLC